jgi:plasmid maintenance system antidote protein VapI
VKGTRAKKEFSQKIKPIQRHYESPVMEYPLLPIKVLKNYFLKPMGWSTEKFVKRIGFNIRHFKHIERNHCRMNFELAIRIGEAFNMDPLYWVRLQLERDIHRYETRKDDGRMHLNGVEKLRKKR